MTLTMERHGPLRPACLLYDETEEKPANAGVEPGAAGRPPYALPERAEDLFQRLHLVSGG
jgi:hypothetical protein